MGYPTTIQLVVRGKGNQWYVNFPSAIAKAMDFKKREVVEWTIVSNKEFRLKRTGKINILRARKQTDQLPLSSWQKRQK